MSPSDTYCFVWNSFKVGNALDSSIGWQYADIQVAALPTCSPTMGTKRRTRKHNRLNKKLSRYKSNVLNTKVLCIT